MKYLKKYIAITALSTLANVQAQSWSGFDRPTPEAARSIGQTNNGCIAGAKPLPLEGEGYFAMHLERNRYYGHPSLIEAIQTLAKLALRNGIGKLQIGDLGQTRGGPMPFGHKSHQTGLDVDIWFNLNPDVYAHLDGMRANVSAPSMLTPGLKSLDQKLWTPYHEKLLKLTAELDEVDRIFVNPYIKKALCAHPAAWLHKIRPWYHHHDHFHVRIACQAGSPECERAPAIPAGDGCDASLDWWFETHPPGPPAPPMPPMPEACQTLMNQP